MWTAIRDEERTPAQWIHGQLDAGIPLFGFEAGAYPGGDPRGDHLIAMVEPRLKHRKKLSELLSVVREETGQWPSVDLGLVLMCEALGFPPGSATIVFVIGRTAGWLAHIEEQTVSGDLIRPRARHTGPADA